MAPIVLHQIDDVMYRPVAAFRTIDGVPMRDAFTEDGLIIGYATEVNFSKSFGWSKPAELTVSEGWAIFDLEGRKLRSHLRSLQEALYCAISNFGGQQMTTEWLADAPVDHSRLG